MDFGKAINKDKDLDSKLMTYDTKNKNHKVLELTKNAPGEWGKYEKQGGVLAHKAEKKTYIKSLENKTGEEVAKKGDWILMGIKGEEWVTNDKTFTKKYGAVSKEGKQEKDGRMYDWHDVKKGSPVAALKMHIPFKVFSSWSKEPLSGKKGDYIVKNYSDLSNTNPQDVWIVDSEIFNKTYKELI